MNAQDLLQNASKLNSYDFESRLNKLVRENYRYKNLDEKNRKVVLGLIKKYSTNIRRGEGISAYAIREESYKLYQRREELDLTEDDLDDIKEILGVFKK